MKICCIASGSSGNCVYIGDENTNLLIDIGISVKKAEEGLIKNNIEPSSINAILVTHEHSDHIKGIGYYSRKYNVPVYATKETLSEIIKYEKKDGIGSENLVEVSPDVNFYIGGILVNAFKISHDAKNPICYTFMRGKHKIGFATDLGKYDDYIISNLINSEVLYLEANHDINMLMVGHYPYALKRRIAGDKGHLSNDDSAGLICKLLNRNLKMIYLAHLSKDNNFAQLAYETVKCEVYKNWFPGIETPQIVVANRDIPTQPYTINNI